MNKRLLFLCLLLGAAGAALPQPQETDHPSSAYIQALAVDPQDPQRVYAATMGAGLTISDDGGDFWRPVVDLSEHKSMTAVELDPQDPTRIYTGGDHSGVWMSTDRGDSWTFIGLDSANVCDIAVHPQISGWVLVLASDGVYRCKQVGAAPWEHVFDYAVALADAMPSSGRRSYIRFSRFQKVEIDPHHPQTVLLSSRWEGGFRRSDDGGDTWIHHTLGGLFRRMDPILFHPDDPDIVFVGTHHQGLFKSHNRGQSWVSTSLGMQPQRRTPYYGAYLISGLAMAPSDHNVLYTGSDNSNWKSIDGGLSWQELGKTLTCPFARAFAVHPQNADIVWAGTNVGVYKSIDGGATWTFSSNGMPQVAIRATTDLQLQDGLYRFAWAGRSPQVFRRPLEPLGPWLPVNWLLSESAATIEKGDGPNEIRLVSDVQTYTSHDGGLRWQDRDPRFVEIASPVETLAFSGDRSDPDLWTVEIELNGRAFFDDRWVGTLYRRTPYIALYLVTPDYPLDRSVPFWQTTVDRAMRFTVQIPRRDLPKDKALFYCEVRDFQRNTLFGFAPVQPGKSGKVVLDLAPDQRLPGLQKQFEAMQPGK